MNTIIADENIPLARELFGTFGDVILLPGRELDREHVKSADALIVRSVTKVNAALLESTPVKFVGTATIGIDHLDIPFLEANHITWSSAAGSNARSVVEWVLAAIFEYHAATGESWRGKTLGIVGHGNIGTRLEPVARGLGLRVLICDPPKARSGDASIYTKKEDLYRQSDIISFHVPLVRDGEDRTIGLLNIDNLSLLKSDALVLNASRGDVITTEAALHAACPLILDVFENEPRPNKRLVEQCYLATPHIAGYSREGKLNGSAQIAAALAKHLGQPAPSADPWLAIDPTHISVAGLDPENAILHAVRASYDIRADSARLREGLQLDDHNWGLHFDKLRKNYPVRREFKNYCIDGVTDEQLSLDLLTLGFKLA